MESHILNLKMLEGVPENAWGRNADSELVLLVTPQEDKPPHVEVLHRGAKFDEETWRKQARDFFTHPLPSHALEVLDALRNQGEEGGGYWWCGNCKEEVDGSCVTHQELHQDCGYPVTWIEPGLVDLAAMVTALRFVAPAVATITNAGIPERSRKAEAERIVAMAQSALDLSRHLTVPCPHGSVDGTQCCKLGVNVADVGPDRSEGTGELPKRSETAKAWPELGQRVRLGPIVGQITGVSAGGAVGPPIVSIESKHGQDQVSLETFWARASLVRDVEGLEGGNP